MIRIHNRFLQNLVGSVFNLLPILTVILVFQVLVIHQPLENTVNLLGGTFLIIIGLTFFIQGLEIGLFPVGETMATAFAKKGSLTWLMAFSFALGFATTIAEPALIAVADEAARVAGNGGLIDNNKGARIDYALGLRLSVALSVGLALVVGVLRIIRGWPLQHLIMGGYASILLMTAFTPREMIGIAYDSGGVTTSTITVPLVTALGIGLASSIKSRNPLIDGFGLIAFASLTPIIFVMAYGLIV
ncbi:MAG: DUF1538 domain-containing protein [Methylococcales bacterium]|jgi:hypothetical protein|nr:DUF1538 domain-containing protein [Methylococcales bacterium]MEE2766146.1 DUF1538 domain-containing protein [Pseudomonadota bacterium]